MKRSAEATLHDAILDGNLPTVQKLIAAGTDLNRIFEEDDLSPLMLAAKQGQTKIVRALIEAGADVNLPDNVNHTALHHAVAGNRPQIIRLLMEAAAESDQVGSLWPFHTPLMFAVMEGRTRIARVLLSCGADVDAADERGLTALMKTCENGTLNAVRTLLRFGADPNKTNLWGQTALLYCLTRKKIARLLLHAGADPNRGDRPSANPLWQAVEQQLVSTVRWLLQAGASPNLVCSRHDFMDGQISPGTTLLMYVAATGRVRMIRLLLRAGVDPTPVNDDGQTALQLALINKHPSIAEMLLPSSGALGDSERGLLAIAQLIEGAKTGKSKLVRRGLSGGADINFSDSDEQSLGFTPLMHACRAGHSKVTNLLVAAGADIARKEITNFRTGRGYSALHYAAEEGHGSCIQVLIDAQAEVDSLDHRGNTALMLAAAGGHLDVVEILIQHGADLDVRCLETGHELTTTVDSDSELANHGTLAVPYVRPLSISDDSGSGIPTQITNASAVSGKEKTVPNAFDRIAENGWYSESPAFTAIEIAAFRGHLEVVKALFHAGATGQYGALFAACLGLHEEVAEWLLAARVKPYYEHEALESPLHAVGRFQACVRLPDSPSEQTPRLADRAYLSELAFRQERLANSLLVAGANVEARDMLGRTPLHAAAHNLSMQTILRGDPTRTQWRENQQVNPIGLVHRLLEFGADPNAVDKFGRIPIMLAVVRVSLAFPYHPEVVDALVSAGAKLDARDLFGRTAMMLAVCHGQTEAVWQMLRLGADPRRTDHWGRTVLHWAVHSSAQPETIHQLVRAGVDPQAVDCEGLTALDYARAVCRSGEVVDLFIELGVTDHWGPVVEFCTAVESGQTDRALKLLNSVSDLHQFVWNQSPWLAALESRQLDLIEELLQHGADLNARLYPPAHDFYRGDAASALHWAAFHGVSEVARLLLRYGADTQQTDERGRTPVTCAATGRHFELMDELLQAGGSLDPLAEIYAELRELPARVQDHQFLDAVKSLTNLFSSQVRHIEEQDSVHYWSLTAEDDETIARGGQYIRNGHPSLAERLAQHTKMESLLDRAQQQLMSFPYRLCDMCESRSHDSSHLVGLVPTPDQLVAVAAIGTFGNEDELSTDRLVEFLLEVQQTAPFEIIALGRDSLGLRFLSEIEDPVSLARRLYEICPNVISKGYGTMDQLIEAIGCIRMVHLWWD